MIYVPEKISLKKGVKFCSMKSNLNRGFIIPHLITRCDGDEATKGADKSHIHNISLVQFNIFFIAGHQTCPRSPVPTQD